MRQTADFTLADVKQVCCTIHNILCKVHLLVECRLLVTVGSRGGGGYKTICFCRPELELAPVPAVTVGPLKISWLRSCKWR